MAWVSKQPSRAATLPPERVELLSTIGMRWALGHLRRIMWSPLEPRLPSPGGRGRWNDHRTVLNGILFRVRTGVPWRDLPERYGSWKTVYERHRHWSADGTWDRLLQAVQAAAGRIDWSMVGVDSTSCRAHQHGAAGMASALASADGAQGGCARGVAVQAADGPGCVHAGVGSERFEATGAHVGGCGFRVDRRVRCAPPAGSCAGVDADVGRGYLAAARGVLAAPVTVAAWVGLQRFQSCRPHHRGGRLGIDPGPPGAVHAATLPVGDVAQPWGDFPSTTAWRQRHGVPLPG